MTLLKYSLMIIYTKIIFLPCLCEKISFHTSPLFLSFNRACWPFKMYRKIQGVSELLLVVKNEGYYMNCVMSILPADYGRYWRHDFSFLFLSLVYDIVRMRNDVI